jgi:intein/homing endonuclease
MSNIEVWSDNGFVKLEQVVRHKTTKKMFRVLTHTGIVDVTEDHSLLLKDGSEIKPTDTSIGTELLHKDILDAFSNTFNKITVNEAKVMGFFFGDGSCGKYGEGKRVKNVWALNNSNLDYLLEMQNLAPFPTSVYDTLNSSGVYKLNATGNVKEIVKKYRDLFYNSYKQKIIPSEILNSTCEIKQAFWDGYYMADGDKDTNGYIRCDTKGKEGAMGLFALGR